MALNQGLGAGDPDTRLPPQKLTILLPRYNNPIQIIQGGQHVAPPSGGLRARIPLAQAGLKTRTILAWNRFRGKM